MDKKKEGLEETAKVYASFVESFQGPPGASSLHPAARIALANQRLAGLNASLPPHLDAGAGGRPGWGPPVGGGGGGGRIRNGPPAFGGREFTPASRPGLAPGLQQAALPPKSDEPPPPIAKKTGRGAKKRNIDAFLEEMKRRDEMREQHLDPDALPFALQQQQQQSPFLSTPPLSLLETPRPGPPLLPYALPVMPSSLIPPANFGSHDVGDVSTTNLYVGNLPPEVTEEILAKEFGAYGDIASVKIMWPRTEEEHARRKNCGFVSYMDRKDAEEAVEKLRELALFGSAIRVGWSKPVALPQTPLYVCPDPNRKRATPLPVHVQATVASGGFTQQQAAAEESVIEIPTGHPRFEIVLPQDPYLLFLINRLALYVSKMGQNFEKLIMERESQSRDPRFAFLFMIQSPEHMYYRWKTYSLSQKDTMEKWRTVPFQMITGGPFWIPPPLTELKQSNSRSTSRSRSRSSSRSRSRSSSSSSSGSSRSRSRSESRERKPVRKGEKEKPKVKGWDVQKPPEGTEPLKPFAVPSYPTSYNNNNNPSSGNNNNNNNSSSSSARLPSSASRLRPADAEKFEDMLRDLTTDRQSIAEGMAFALDHAEQAKEIVEIITDAMSIIDTPVAKKIARLFLISDILYNSSAPVKNASAYRSAFQYSLKTVFQGLADKFATLEGRMAAQQMKDKVESVLNAWHAWSIFPPTLMATLEAWKDVKRRKAPSESLDGEEYQQQPEQHQQQEEQQKKKARVDKVEILGGVPLNTYDDDSDEDKPQQEDDDEDVDGVPLTETTGAEEDVDGIPLTLNLPDPSKTSEKKKKHSGLGGTMYADSDDEDEIDGAPL